MYKARSKSAKRRSKTPPRFTGCVVKVHYHLLERAEGEMSMTFKIDLRKHPHTRLVSIEKQALRELAAHSRMWREFDCGIELITIRMVEPAEPL